jgi:hypothetical protein
MSKLLQRLGDASRSGVYRAPHGRDILDALRGGDLDLARVDLAGTPGKAALLERIAKSLAFPKWFGGNWDALEECLGDLALSGVRGQVVLFEGMQGLAATERSELLDVLAAAAGTWKARGRPFFAVIVDATAPLPELYKPRR